MSKIVLFSILILLATAGYFGVRSFRNKLAEGPPTGIAPPIEIMSQEKLIEKYSKEKLAQYLAIEENQIEIIKTEKVDWPDASLGAPEQGMMYAQVITPGYKVTMMAVSVLYEAHTDEQGNQVVLIQNNERLK